MSQQQIPLEKMLEKYGKACLERDIAFERIAQLEQEIEILKNQPPKKPVDRKVAADGG